MNFLELFKSSGLIGAHRGARAIAPENTLSSLRAALGHCDFIEVDVQLSSDGVGVIIHDETLQRTTNITKIKEYSKRYPYNVSEFTYSELDSLDYGSWFYETNPYRQKLSKPQSTYEPLLSYKELLSFIKTNGVFVNIEIKDMKDYFSDEEVVKIVLEEIKSFGVEDFVIISSFRHKYLSLSKKMMPNIPTAALVENSHPSNMLEYLHSLNVDAYNPDDCMVDKELVSKLKEAGFFVNVYTVNEKKRIEELFRMGVNGVFSDYLWA